MSRTDTHPEALGEQIRLLRACKPVDRVAAACALTQHVRALSWRNLVERMPAESDSARRVAWAAALYGTRLVKALGVGADTE